MPARRFALYNVAGGLLWVVLFVYAGALLGGHPLVRQHLGALAIGIVVVSLLPVAWGALRASRGARH
jgi:membrane-associated protein